MSMSKDKGFPVLLIGGLALLALSLQRPTDKPKPIEPARG